MGGGQGKDSVDAPSLGPPPLAIVARVKSALRLVALDESAERLGLTRGMALADARAMIPALAVADDDPAADATLIAAIADWAERYTPLVALDADENRPGLFLDITGCAHLFGGESTLIADLVARLRHQGFSARAAIADTPGAASALARYGPDSICLVAPGGATVALENLPLAALRLAPDTVAALDRVGLKRIGQIVGAPRAPLAARFGRGLTRRLDQALGSDEEAISPRRPAPALLAERRFAEPIGLEEDVAAALDSLAATLCQTMEARGLGARLIELALFRVDGAVSRVVVGTGRPLRDAKRIGALFREKFLSLGDTLDAGFGFDMVRLAVVEAAPLSATQIDLDGAGNAETDLDGLVDRIGARLGPNAVGRLAPRDSHIPERAEAFADYGESPDISPSLSLPHKGRGISLQGNESKPDGDPQLTSPFQGEEEAAAAAEQSSDSPIVATARNAQWNGRGFERVAQQRTPPPERGRMGGGHGTFYEPSEPISRPLRLFARPEPVEAVAEVPDGPPARFRWRRTLYRVARAEGPERIAAEWWRDDDLTRDYFRVEDPVGHRFWLFREGLYGRETTAPRWYLHGVFA